MMQTNLLNPINRFVFLLAGIILSLTGCRQEESSLSVADDKWVERTLTFNNASTLSRAVYLNDNDTQVYDLWVVQVSASQGALLMKPMFYTSGNGTYNVKLKDVADSKIYLAANTHQPHIDWSGVKTEDDLCNVGFRMDKEQTEWLIPNKGIQASGVLSFGEAQGHIELIPNFGLLENRLTQINASTLHIRYVPDYLSYFAAVMEKDASKAVYSEIPLISLPVVGTANHYIVPVRHLSSPVLEVYGETATQSLIGKVTRSGNDVKQIEGGKKYILTDYTAIETLNQPKVLQNNTNCFLIPPSAVARTYRIDTPLSSANKFEQAILKPETTTTDIASVDIAWQNTLELVSVTHSLQNGQVEFTVNADKTGNALIYLRGQDGKPKWSWHIWVTDYRPDTAISYSENQYIYRVPGGEVYRLGEPMWRGNGELSGHVVMDRFLGEDRFEEDTFQPELFKLIYQIGRKDPFPDAIKHPVYRDGTSLQSDEVLSQHLTAGITENALLDNITHLYIVDTRLEDWYTGIPMNRWFSQFGVLEEGKTLFDPCPQGWRLPPEGAFSEFVYDSYNPQASNINDVRRSPYLQPTLLYYRGSNYNFTLKYWPVGEEVPTHPIVFYPFPYWKSYSYSSEEWKDRHYDGRFVFFENKENSREYRAYTGSEYTKVIAEPRNVMLSLRCVKKVN